jgi:Fe-S-cluster containining protein
VSELWLPRLLDGEKEATGIQEVTARGKEGALRCEFLQEGSHHCSIYSQRPFECRLYPFLIVPGTGGTLDLSAHLGCPFVLAMAERAEFKDYLKYLLTLFEGQEVQAMLKNGREQFRRYPVIELIILKENILSGRQDVSS